LYPEQPQGAPVPQYPAAPQPPSMPTWPASPGPPISGPPISGGPSFGGYPQSPPRAPRSMAFPLLLVLAIVLLLAAIGTIVVGASQIGDLRNQVESLEAERDASKQKVAAAATKLDEDFKTADLPGKLAKIKELDKAADAKFTGWKAGGTKFGELSGAMQACDDQVHEYHRAAARFPAEKFNSELPQKIDFANRDTDCGRAFVSSI